MRVYDPYAHTTVPLCACEVVEADGDYSAVRSRKEGKWFALHMPTNGTLRLSQLGEEATRLEEAVNYHEFQEKLLTACQWVRDHPEAMTEELTREAVREAEETYGVAVVRAAAVMAQTRFTYAETLHAFERLEASDAVSLDDVETVRISELVE